MNFRNFYTKTNLLYFTFLNFLKYSDNVLPLLCVQLFEHLCVVSLILIIILLKLSITYAPQIQNGYNKSTYFACSAVAASLPW